MKSDEERLDNLCKVVQCQQDTVMAMMARIRAILEILVSEGIVTREKLRQTILRAVASIDQDKAEIGDRVKGNGDDDL